MKKVFEAEGVFYKYEEKSVDLRDNDRLVHRQESPTELWWHLKEAIKGKRVKIVVYEGEE